MLLSLLLSSTLTVAAEGPHAVLNVQAPPAASCDEWHDCERLALAAAARGDYEAFHDLAWRTVQTGPPRDPSLLYLLARAQCLSGRPHDALVMLQRLAEMGAAPVEAITNDDFRRTRALPGWGDVHAAIERAQSGDAAARAAATPASAADSATLPPARPATSDTADVAAPPPPATAEVAAPPSPGSPAGRVPAAASAAATTDASASAGAAAASANASSGANTMVLEPEPIEQPVELSARFAAGGLAYDAVSQRFVVGDLHGRKLMVVSEGSSRPIDLVRADSAGFRDIKAVEIDPRRGDLWVATGAADSHEWTLHKMQLVSGRPLKSIAADEDDSAMELVDLAVTPGGSILALDAAGGRLLRLAPSASTLKLILRMDVEAPASVAATANEDVVYVAHGGGISRIDLKSAAFEPVKAPAGIDVGRIERIRSHRNALIAVQRDAAGSRRVVRLDLNQSGRAVTAATIIDASIPPATGPTFATISGDDLCYLVAAGGSAEQPAEFVIRRIRLR